MPEKEQAGTADPFPKMAAIFAPVIQTPELSPRPRSSLPTLNPASGLGLRICFHPRDSRKWDATRVEQRLYTEACPLLLLVGILTPPYEEVQAGLPENEGPRETGMSIPSQASPDKPACQPLNK